MNIIADTNIWYNIASERVNISDLKTNDEDLLFATPINILEIISNVSDFQFDKRKKAIIAIINYSDRILEDTEIHLARLWNKPLTPNNFKWDDILKAVNGANDLDDLRIGVLDFVNKVTRKVKVDLTHLWRIRMWENFKNEIEKTIDSNILPGYLDAREGGKIKHLNKKKGAELKKRLFSDICQDEILNGTFDRANLVLLDYGQRLNLKDRDPYINSMVRQDAFRNLLPYTQAYAQYLFKCSTEYAAEDNDWGDLEHFIYLQGENRLLTFEKRWNEIAKDSGNELWLYK